MQRAEEADQGGRRGLGVGDHVLRGAEEVVKGKEVDGRDLRAVGRGVLQYRLLRGRQAGRERRQRVRELDAVAVRRGPRLGDGDRLVAPVNAGRVVYRITLDIE